MLHLKAPRTNQKPIESQRQSDRVKIVALLCCCALCYCVALCARPILLSGAESRYVEESNRAKFVGFEDE